MRGTQAIIGHSGALPSRAVIRIPSLEIVALEATDGTAIHGIGSAEELFTTTSAEIINGAIIDALTADVVWSGELQSDLGNNGDGTTTAVTLWIPHHRAADEAPTEATILIGAAITEHASRVAPDPLTSLPTRVVLLDRLDQARRRSRRNGDLMAALFIDLDGLKSINDRLGHEGGDAALIRAADRIRTCMRDGDTVARFGGDEFVVLCESIEEETQARRVAERILEQLDSDQQQPLSASIGLAFDRGGSLSSLELVGRADAAMYRAKSRGGGRFEVFDTEMQGLIAADETMRSKLLVALQGDGLDVAAQPIFELSTGRVVGAELFIRLRDGDHGLIGGRDVLRLIREHSEAIDASMLGRAIAVARSWRRDFGRAAPRIHVNVSSQSLASPDFVQRVSDACERHRVPARSFAFEVDAYDFVPMGSSEYGSLAALQDMGAAVAIDGFGLGSTSLGLVNRIQPNMVKIAAHDPDGKQTIAPDVVIGLVRAATSLGVGTCVKGIETRHLLDRVVQGGAFAGQGEALSPVTTLPEVHRTISPTKRIGF